jgi:hypothetical protein
MWTTKRCPPILKPIKAWGSTKYEHHWTRKTSLDYYNSLVKSLNNGSSKLKKSINVEVEKFNLIKIYHI